MTIVNLDAHLLKTARLWELESPYCACDDVKISNLDYTKLTINSQYTYLLDNYIPSLIVDTIDQYEKINDTSLEQQLVVERSETSNSTYSWTTEMGMSIGISVSATLRVPFVGGLDTTVETNFSVNSTQSHTEERSRTWLFQDTVNVAPRTRVVATLLLEKTRPQIPFNLTTTMSGTIPYDVAYLRNGQWSPFMGGMKIYLASHMNRYPLANITVGGNIIYFSTSGVFQANEGIKATIYNKEYSLTDLQESTESLSKEWTIDVYPQEYLVKEASNI